MDFPDETEYILDHIIDSHYGQEVSGKLPGGFIHSASKFRETQLKKIFYQSGS
jgi:hypothetical protein